MRGIVLTGLLAAAGAAGLGFLSYRSELDRARDAAGQGSLLADLAIGRIEYAEAGQGVPLLSIHGAGGGFDQGLTNAAELAGEGFRVVAPSRFGYLRTPVPPDSSPAAQAEAHAALLASLGIPAAVILGVSAGARSAVELALRHPERVAALVLVVPALDSPADPVSIEPSFASRLAFGIVNAGGDVAWWAAERLAPSRLIRFLGVDPALVAAAAPAERERIMAVVRSVQPLSLRMAGINIDSAPDRRDPPLEAISAPTLVVTARDDLFNTLPAAELAARRIPGAELVVYPTGGHLLVGRGPEIRAAIRSFLARAGLDGRSAADHPPAQADHQADHQVGEHGVSPSRPADPG